MIATLFLLSPRFSERAHVEAFFLGCSLLVVITVIHIAGLNWIIGRYKRKIKTFKELPPSLLLALFYFGVTILLMLLLHVGDLTIWAVIVNRMGLISDIHDAIYFTANTYTTLGYGDMILPYNWRELSPLMAISGLFTFACTTGQLFSVMGFHNDVVEALNATHDKHSDSR